MDLSLKEIFYSVAIIEPDAYKVWNELSSAYPPAHFDGVIEDTFGQFYDED